MLIQHGAGPALADGRPPEAWYALRYCGAQALEIGLGEPASDLRRR